MKKEVLLCLLVMMLCTVFIANKADAKRKTEKISIIMDQNNVYSINGLFTMLSKQCHPSVRGTANRILKEYKKCKLKWNGKHWKITKKTIMAKKLGNLTLKAKSKKYIFTLKVKVVPSAYTIDRDKVRWIEYTDVTGKWTQYEIRDDNVISQLIEKINLAQYRFDFIRSNYRKAGWSRRLTLCGVNDECMYDFMIFDGVIRERYFCGNTQTVEALNIIKFLDEIKSQGLYACIRT